MQRQDAKFNPKRGSAHQDSARSSRSGRPPSGSMPMPHQNYQSMPQDAMWGGGVPDVMPWPMVGQPGNPSVLADAYGASHGQPQSGMAGLDWFNGANAAMMSDPMNGPFGVPNNYHTNTTAQLTQQLNALHLQNQQNEQIVMQQNKLLAQLQAAQEMRAKAELEASAALLQQQQLSSHHELPSNPRHGMNKRQGMDFSHLANSSPSNRYSGSSLGVSLGSAHDSDQCRSKQLPPDVSKAMSTMNALRQQHAGDQSYDGSDSSFSRSPRPNSYGGRDRNRESGNMAQGGMRSESRRTSTVQRNEKQYGMDTPERHRAVTPSIVIESASQIPSLPHPPLPADVNAVGMRIGQRTMPVVDSPGGNAHSRQPDTHHGGENLPSTPNNRQDKRQSYHELGAGKPSSRPSDAGPRPGSSPQPPHTALIQPRRQPRGPPMESFFANNFLARRSLRTRREAMSKLCSSPRAASFSGPKSTSPQAVSSPLARQA